MRRGTEGKAENECIQQSLVDISVCLSALSLDIIRGYRTSCKDEGTY